MIMNHEVTKTLIIKTFNGKILIKQKKNGKDVRIYLSQEEAFKLAYKLMSVASEL